MAKVIISKREFVCRPAHESDLLSFIVSQATAKGQAFEVSIQPHALGRAIGCQQPKCLASSTTAVQYSGFLTEASRFKDGRLDAIIRCLTAVFSSVVVQFVTQPR
jgi:hypothetical protein